MLIGAEFTQVYAKAYGSQIEPEADAVPVTEEAHCSRVCRVPTLCGRPRSLKSTRIGGDVVTPMPGMISTPQTPSDGVRALVEFAIGLS